MDNFIRECKKLVLMKTYMSMDKSDDIKITDEDVYVVWSCKTLQNAKALLSTNIPDGMYYEVTYNGDKEEMYIDSYRRIDNELADIKVTF